MGHIGIFLALFLGFSLALSSGLDTLLVLVIGDVSESTEFGLRLLGFVLTVALALFATYTIRKPRTPAAQDSTPEVRGGPAVAAALAPAGQQPQQERRPRRSALVVVLVAAFVLLAAAAVAAAVLVVGDRNNGTSERPAPAEGDSGPAGGLFETAEPSEAEALRRYFNDIMWVVVSHSDWVTWEWSAGGTHRGALFGSGVAVERNADGSRTWLAGRSNVRNLASNFEIGGMDLAAVEAPARLRREHEKLVRAYRIESRRWERFDAVLRRADDDNAEWKALQAWEKWSKSAFATQRRHLDDWVFAVRAEARKQRVELPGWLKHHMARVERLTR
jgi:hypothetical protein